MEVTLGAFEESDEVLEFEELSTRKVRRNEGLLLIKTEE